MKAWMKLAGVAMVGGLCIYGCGKGSDSGKVDLNKPMEQVQSEAQKMNVDDLKAQAEAYKKELTGKKAEMDTVTKKIKDLPVTQMLGTEASKLKDQLAELTKSSSQLSERLNVYLEELKKKKVDTSALEAK